MFSIPNFVFGILQEWRDFCYRPKLHPITEHYKSGDEKQVPNIIEVIISNEKIKKKRKKKKEKRKKVKKTGCHVYFVVSADQIIIILSRHQHGYPWSSLATPPYRSSLPAGPQGYTPYPHRAAVCRFELATQLLHGHMKGSIEVYHLWARSYFSSSILHVWFV